jgi:hypothetical protein
MSTLLLAHQGGWDEALLILVPVGVFVALLSLANKRAKAVQRQRAETAAMAERDDAPTTTSGD